MEHGIIPLAGSISVAAIALFIACMQGMIFLYNRKYTWNGWSSLVAFSSVVYACAVALQYSSGAEPVNIIAEKIQYTAIVMIVHSVTGFSLSFLRINSRMYHVLFGLLHGAICILIWGTGLIITDAFISRHFSLLSSPYIEPVAGPLGKVFIVYAAAASLMMLYFWVRKFTYHKKRSTAFILGTGIWGLLGTHDVAATLGMPSVMYLMEYGFLGFTIFILIVSSLNYIHLYKTIRFHETSLAREKEQLAITLRAIGDGVIAVDALCGIVMMNQVAEKLTKWGEKEALGKQVLTVLNLRTLKKREPAADFVKMVIEKNAHADLPSGMFLLARDSSEYAVSCSCAPIHNPEGGVAGAVIIFRDITQRQKLEELEFRSRNIESIGILARGIAHDFNNVLMRIAGNISIALAKKELDSKVRAPLEDAHGACRHAKDLTTQLLNFARGNAPVRTDASIKEVITETVSFILNGSDISCSYSIPDDIGSVTIDKVQISQALHNIVLNARQAMDNRGKLTVSADTVSVYEGTQVAGIQGDLVMKPGPYIRIVIRDTGPGIPEGESYKIFDPYYTTKEEGTGLGLSIAYSIITGHGGVITVNTEAPVGGEFNIYLPATGTGAQSEK